MGELWQVVIPVATLLLGVALGYLLLLRVERRAAASIRSEAERVLEDARKEAERLVKEGAFRAKEELLERRERAERELAETRAELKDRERRLERREAALEQKLEQIEEKERAIRAFEARFQERQRELDEAQARAREHEQQLLAELERTARMSREQARATLLERLERELEHEQAQLVQRALARAKEEADRRAREVLTTAIQRVAAAHTAEVTTSVVNLPNDELKGRVIGREGRNIRAFEKATGVDVIVDDTPGVVVLSAFDGVRREVARRAMERLLADGRIHPARIEEVVAQCQQELEAFVLERGQQAVLELELPGLHPKLVQTLGRLHFRTSYGQNVLQHSIEVAQLCGALAGELGLEVKLAKRCGLLHDIGKALDHEVEGGHPAIGAEFARRYQEPKEVVNAIASHHDDVPQESLYAFLVMAADAVSGSRPGARGESLERYLKRLSQLEEVARAFPGVRQVYAIQAGREVRVVVNANKVTDRQAAKLARDIARQIEKDLTYPGEIKVTLLRETRVVEYAR
ncbi:MAG: ribonuclease Y [Planctomycetota bacterium]|nr:MAG: ribonuclease Y [Planctomycetota bacterium]